MVIVKGSECWFEFKEELRKKIKEKKKKKKRKKENEKKGEGKERKKKDREKGRRKEEKRKRRNNEACNDSTSVADVNVMGCSTQREKGSQLVFCVYARAIVCSKARSFV